MKRFFFYSFFLLLILFYPKYVFAEDSITFTTSIINWKNYEYFSIKEGNYPENTIVSLSFEGVVDGISHIFSSNECSLYTCNFDEETTVKVYETIDFSNFSDFDNSYSLNYSTIDTSLPDFIKESIFSSYRETGVKNISVSCSQYDENNVCLERNVFILEDENTDLGAIQTPTFQAIYHFVVKGNIANIDGDFSFQNTSLDSLIHTVNPNEDLFFSDLDYSTLESLFEGDYDISYQPNDTLNNTYSLSVFSSNQSDSFEKSLSANEGVYTLSFDVEARLDSTIAHTGVIYDNLPFLFLILFLLLAFFIVRKDKINEEKLDEDEII